MPLDFSYKKVLYWFMKNNAQSEKSLCSEDIQRIALEMCMPQIRKDDNTGVVIRRKRPVRDDNVTINLKKLEEPSLCIVKRTTSKDTEALLSPTQGANNHNNQDLQKHKSFQEKTICCSTNNNFYKWRMSDNQIARCLKKYRRYSTSLNQFERLSDPQPEPHHAISPRQLQCEMCPSCTNKDLCT